MPMANPSGSAIKGVQRYTIAIPTQTPQVTSQTATITSVVTTKCHLTLLGTTTADATNTYSAATDVIQSYMGYLSLTNATTVTATRPTASNPAKGLTLSGEAVEFR